MADTVHGKGGGGGGGGRGGGGRGGGFRFSWGRTTRHNSDLSNTQVYRKCLKIHGLSVSKTLINTWGGWV